MRTWFGFNSKGCFCSIESHVGGWPVEADFNNPVSHPSLSDIVRQRKAAGVIGFYMYDCPCSEEAQTCNCHNAFMQTYYIDSGVVGVKPATSLKINGITFASRAVVPVGATFTAQITGDVPDGAEVDLFFHLPPAAKETVTLVFTGGATEARQFAMPVPGNAMVGAWGKLVRSVGVVVQRPMP